MNDFLLSINDYSSFIELYTGLLFAFSGIDRLRDFVKNRINQQLQTQYTDIKTKVDKSAFFQIPILHPELIAPPKIKKIYDWLDVLLKTYPNIPTKFEVNFLKIKITASHIAIFGGVLLLQMGFTVNKNEFYLSYFSINLQELTYKVLLIYSIFVGLFVTSVFIFDKITSAFEESTANLFIKNFLLSFFFFIFSLLLTLFLTLSTRFFNYSNLIQNASVFVSIFIFIVCYPIFIISTFTKFTISIYHKFRVAEYYFLKEDISIDTDISVQRDHLGKFKIKKWIIDTLKALWLMIKHNFFDLRPYLFSSFIKRFKLQSITLLVTGAFSLFVLLIFYLYNRTLDEAIQDLISKANGKTFIIYKNLNTYNDNDIKDELSEFYHIDEPAFIKIDSIIRCRRNDSLTISDESKMMIHSIKLIKDKIDYDTITVHTKEKWYVVWENSKNKTKVRYSSDTTVTQEYMLCKQLTGNWKILTNIYSGKIDTLRTR